MFAGTETHARGSFCVLGITAGSGARWPGFAPSSVVKAVWPWARYPPSQCSLGLVRVRNIGYGITREPSRSELASSTVGPSADWLDPEQGGRDCERV